MLRRLGMALGTSLLLAANEQAVGPGYSVLAKIARGGTSHVLLAVDAATGERVALKSLLPELADCAELRARLHAEQALVARGAGHPNLVAIHAVETAADGSPFLVMEYLDGESLGSLVDHLGRGRLELSMALAITAQVAAALAALHAGGVAHCDVKPDNVIVLDAERDGVPRVKLIDFGVSRVVRTRFARGSLPTIAIADVDVHGDGVDGEVDSGIAGTPWCMAPEQWHGRPEAASDVYALGCLIFDLVTGQAPFVGSVPELMTAHLELPAPELAWLADAMHGSECRGVARDLEHLVMRMLRKDPAARPAMAEVAEALVTLATDAMTLAEPAADATLEMRAAC